MGGSGAEMSCCGGVQSAGPADWVPEIAMHCHERGGLQTPLHRQGLPQADCGGHENLLRFPGDAEDGGSVDRMGMSWPRYGLGFAFDDYHHLLLLLLLMMMMV